MCARPLSVLRAASSDCNQPEEGDQHKLLYLKKNRLLHPERPTPVTDTVTEKKNKKGI